MKPNNDLIKAIHFQRLNFTPNFPDDTCAGKVKRLWVKTPLLEEALVKVMFIYLTSRHI
jgi:hypothetical protein